MSKTVWFVSPQCECNVSIPLIMACFVLSHGNAGVFEIIIIHVYTRMFM